MKEKMILSHIRLRKMCKGFNKKFNGCEKMNFIDRQIKHLEFLQANITRMNNCSFQMKGWSITITSALLALFAASVDKATGQGNNLYVFIAIIPNIIFWFLDSYYLQQERKFRGIYNDIIKKLGKETVKEFSMPLNKYVGCKYCIFNIMFSKTEWPLYFIVILGLGIAGFLL